MQGIIHLSFYPGFFMLWSMIVATNHATMISYCAVICRINRKSGTIRNALKIKVADPQALESEISALLEGKDFGKENLDRVMNNARWLINEISGKL